MSSSMMDFKASLEGPDPIALFDAALASGAFGSGNPAELDVDGKAKKPSGDWRAKWLSSAKLQFFADFGNLERYVSYQPRGPIVGVRNKDFPRQMQRALEVLERLPFTVGAIATIHKSWVDPKSPYWAPALGGLHGALGVACAFRGEGHARLVSRRWLDYGPWLVRRGADDTSLVQFHDLEADAQTALAQAKAGHHRMLGPTGGFLVPPPYESKTTLDALYVATDRSLRLVIHGRPLGSQEMHDAAAARRYQALGEARPIEHVRYVFVDEAAAREHLHELWLHELECWAIVGGREVRLDADYLPAPSPPPWVRAVHG
jgi:hypothetical protein